MNLDTQNRVKQYFRVKTRQLSAIGDLPVCEHPGLIGSHREELQRVYLREILPKRFEVGRGMVYGPFNRSHEADIVIWDSQNYPSLPILDHSFYFAESVRVVLESKSLWSERETWNVLEKCKAIREIVTMPGLSLADEVSFLKHQMAAWLQEQEHEGMVKVPHHIGTAAIFLKGGQSVNTSFIDSKLLEEIDDSWPDILLLLEPGHLIVKNYEFSTSGGFLGQGWLEFYDLGEDALIAFTVGLLEFLAVRSVQIEHPLNLTHYVQELVSFNPIETIDFPLTHPMPQHKHYMGRKSTGMDEE
jgi:hypothetical protein